MQWKVERSSVSLDRMHLELFAGVPWSMYLQRISRVPTYRDESTLCAISRKYAVELRIVFTLGQNLMVVSTPDTLSRRLITIGHFGEENGIHYVVLNNKNQERNNEPPGQWNTQFGYLPSIAQMRNLELQSEPDTQFGSLSSNVDMRNDTILVGYLLTLLS